MTALELEVGPDLRPRVHRIVLLNEVLTVAVVALAVAAVGLLAFVLMRSGPAYFPSSYTGPRGPGDIPVEEHAPVVVTTPVEEPLWDYQTLVTDGRTPPMGLFTSTFDYDTLVTQGRTPPMGDYASPAWRTPLIVTSPVIAPTPDWDWDALVTQGRTPPMGDYR